MLIEDDAPAARPGLTFPALDRMGVGELRVYIAGLRAEIGRAEGEIGRKEGIRAAADSVFSKPG